MTEVSRRSWRPATISGLASIASRIRVEGPGEGVARVRRGDGRRIGEERVGPGDIAQRERERLDPAAVDGGPEPIRRRAEGPRHGRPVGDLRRMLGLPVVVLAPAVHPGQEQRHAVLAGAHVADRARLLAVARQAGGGQLVER